MSPARLQVVLKYVLAPETDKPSIVPVLGSVLGFSASDLRRIAAARAAEESESAAGILSSFFFAPAPPEQGVAEGVGASGAVANSPEKLPPLASPLASLVPPPQQRQPSTAPPPPPTPPLPPTPPPPTPPLVDGDSVDDLRRKVGKLKRLLAAANEHIGKCQQELRDREAKLEELRRRLGSARRV